jgi:phosphoglycolate phosphatase-like HAD superfamily hydrolase
MKKYKILIFDLDDTLIDNRENTRAAFAKMLAAEGGVELILMKSLSVGIKSTRRSGLNGGTDKSKYRRSSPMRSAKRARSFVIGYFRNEFCNILGTR